VKDPSNINWFPGHMAASMRQMGERLALVDVVVQVVDARLPRISGNPLLDELAAKMPRLIVLGREDLADPASTVNWIAWYASQGLRALAVNGKRQGSITQVRSALAQLVAQQKTARAMVVGTPNTGKSTLINGLVRRTAARVEDKAGVTRSLQWFRVQKNLELMDTPGILVPKIATPQAQWMLALCGALPRERYDAEDVIGRFAAWMQRERPRHPVPTLAEFAAARGFKRQGSDLDLHNAAGAYLKDFNDGKFGRITFEAPEETSA
jgi:ribosome biogenesis GTPase A